MAQTRLIRNRVNRWDPDFRNWFRNTMQKQSSIEGNCQQKVSNWPCGDNKDSFPDRLATKFSREVFTSNLIRSLLANIKHLHITTKCKHENSPLRLFSIEFTRKNYLPIPTEKRNTFTPHKRAAR